MGGHRARRAERRPHALALAARARRLRVRDRGTGRRTRSRTRARGACALRDQLRRDTLPSGDAVRVHPVRAAQFLLHLRGPQAPQGIAPLGARARAREEGACR